MTFVDASLAIDSQDCDWPGCAREAEREGRCRYHAGRTPSGHADDPPEKKETPVTEIVLCRVDGCTRASVAQRGPWKGWCVEHKHLRGKQVETPMNPPAPRPSPAGPPQRLQELVTTIAARREELLELQAEALALLDEIREVVAA